MSEVEAEITAAAGRIMDVWMGGDTAWRGRMDKSLMLESEDWAQAMRLARAALHGHVPEYATAAYQNMQWRMSKAEIALGDVLRENEKLKRSHIPTTEVCQRLGAWLSAALDDPNAGEAFKADIRAWFEAGGDRMGPTTEGAGSASVGGEDSPYVAGPAWREEDEEGEVWTSEVQTLGGYGVVLTVHGGSEAEAVARRDACLTALQPTKEQP